MTDFIKNLGELVYQEAPLLGALIPIPGPAGEYAIRAILNAFGVDPEKKEAVIPVIQGDTESASKLISVQNQLIQHGADIATIKHSEDFGAKKDDENSSPHADSSSIRTDNSVKVIVTLDVSKKG